LRLFILKKSTGGANSGASGFAESINPVKRTDQKYRDGFRNETGEISDSGRESINED
jgi:hypothetical protein